LLHIPRDVSNLFFIDCQVPRATKSVFTSATHFSSIVFQFKVKQLISSINDLRISLSLSGGCVNHSVSEAKHLANNFVDLS
jgi:hypothetical protein